MIDVIGDPSSPVDDCWDVKGTTCATKDHTLLRNSNVNTGTEKWEFDTEEWIVYQMDTFILPDGTQLLPSTTSTEQDVVESSMSSSLNNRFNYPSSDPCNNVKEGSCDSIIIGTFNVEWLFDGYDDVSMSPYDNDPDSADKHLEAIADVISKTDSDILSLCEVEDITILEELASVINKDYKSYLIKGTDTSTDQNVGLLTKLSPSMALQRTEDRSE